MDSKQSVLVVEDEPNLRLVATSALSGLGVSIFEAGDASEALQIIHEHPEICLIFSDIKMPGPMDGLGLAMQLHDKNPSVEILITSGVEEIDSSSLPHYGTFIPKPYTPSQLKSIVQAKLMATNF